MHMPFEEHCRVDTFYTSPDGVEQQSPGKQVYRPGRLDRVVVISDDSVESGGAASVVVSSIKALRARGVEVTLINGHGSVGHGLDQLGIEIVTLDGLNLLEASPWDAAISGIFDPHVARTIKRWIKVHDSPGTIYHLHNWHKVLSPSVFSALKDVAHRLFLSVHDYFLACPNGGFYNYRTEAICSLKPLSGQCLTTNCDRRNYAHKIWRSVRHIVRSNIFDAASTDATLLTPHEGMSAYLTRGPIRPAQIVTLPNPVTPWHRHRVQAEANHGIFFIGRLSRDKGIDVLAEAATRAGVQLTIIGDGPLRNPLINEFPQHSFLGWQSPASISNLTRTARLVVVPTRWPETFGLVTFEALLSGIPVLLSRAALVSAEIAADGSGVLCDPGDLGGMAEILNRLRDDDAGIATLSRAAFEKTPLRVSDLARWCDRLLSLYAARLQVNREAANERQGFTEAHYAA